LEINQPGVAREHLAATLGKVFISVPFGFLAFFWGQRIVLFAGVNPVHIVHQNNFPVWEPEYALPVRSILF